MSEQTILPLHTSCKNCVFAKYEDNTQTDCLVGLIDQYKNVGIEILEVYDNDKEFYVINNKVCMARRTPDFFKDTVMQDSSIEDKVAYVKSKLYLKYLAIIDSRNSPPEQLSGVLAKLKETNTPPNTIMVVINEQGAKVASDYYKVLHESGIKSKWKIKANLYKEQDFITTVHQVISLGSEDCPFILAISGDYSRLTEVVDKAHSMAYKEFEPFTVVSNESKETILFSSYVYQDALANKGDIITDYKEYTIV